MLEKLLEKLGKLLLKDVRCKFDFVNASEDQFIAFKKAFNIETKISDWMKDSTRMEYLTEEGQGKFQGMNVALEGPEFQNPNYRPVSREFRDEQYESDENLRILGNHALLLWEAILKDVISFDRDKMIAWFKICGRDWDIAYGQALKYFSKIEKTECCK